MSAMRFRYRRGLNGYGGYRGKERLNRDRSRASRCQARQLVEEYIEADEEAACRVRIGHRSEFIPSVGEGEDEVSRDDGVGHIEVLSRQEQLSLPLGDHKRAVEHVEEREQVEEGGRVEERQPVLRLHSPEPPVAAASELLADTAEDVPTAACPRAPAPAEKPRRAPYEWFVDRRPLRSKTFQRGHFLYGCALGTAAAAAILAMLRVAFM